MTVDNTLSIHTGSNLSIILLKNLSDILFSEKNSRKNIQKKYSTSLDKTQINSLETSC